MSFARKPALGNVFTSGSRALAASAAVLIFVIHALLRTTAPTTMINQAATFENNIPTAVSIRKRFKYGFVSFGTPHSFAR